MSDRASRHPAARSDSPSPTNDRLRSGAAGAAILWLVVATALAVHAARIATVRNDQTRGESPFFSANDRSRWCTIRALVEEGRYEIDRAISAGQAIHWDTIDKVQHVGRDGQLHFYSSKPPLLPTLLAGAYWVVRQATGWTLSEDPLPVARVILLLSNLLWLALLLGCLAAWLAAASWSFETRVLVLVAAGWGTFLTTFAITLNNHLPAAAAVMAGCYLLDRVWRGAGRRSGWTYFGLGMAAAFAVANELPALSFWGACAVLAAGWSWRHWLCGFWPGTLLVALPFFYTNWLAHGELIPAYAHRSDGPELFQVAGDFRERLAAEQPLPDEIAAEFQRSAAAEAFLTMRLPVVEPSEWMGQTEGSLGRWVLRDREGAQQWAIIQVDAERLSVRSWNNWYDYPGSYWSGGADRRSAVDRGESSRVKYALHCLVGHHGFFSLTPLWLVAGFGLISGIASGRRPAQVGCGLGVLLTMVVLGFYVSRESHDRNYGGMTSGLRWTFWLIPFWLQGLAEVGERWFRSRVGMIVIVVLLSASAASAAYAWSNPWVHPWLYEWCPEAWR